MPVAPGSLSAKADGPNRIDLVWSPPASDGGAAISGYRIEVSTDRGSNWTVLVSNTGSTATTYAHTGLAAGTERHYRVSAINTAGAGTASNVASATTSAAGAPGAPTGLTATADGKMAIDLAWTAPGDNGGSAISGYRIEVSSDAGSNWSDLVSDTASTATSYEHTNLDPGTERHYRVSAINTAGTGSASNVAHATTEAEPPGAPTGLTATADGKMAIDLAWTAPADNGGSAISGYRIEVSSDGGSNWTDLVSDTASTATSYEHTNLDPGTERHYRVSAINTAGTGSASNVAHATTEAEPPGAPTGLTATADGKMAIDLAWTAPGDNGGSAISGYRIEVSSDAGSNWSDLVSDTASTATSYEHTNLDPGTERHYRVSAINTAGTGSASNVAHATTEAEPPGAPTGLTATADGKMAIDLAWTAPADNGGSAISGYRIEVSSDGGSNWTDLVSDTASTATSYEHTNLDPGTERHYRVSAINTAGTGSASNVAHATTEAEPPGAPTGLTATADGKTAIDLAWTVPDDTGGAAVSGYRIEVSSDAGSNWADLVANTGTTATTYAHTGLAAGTERHYRVSAINTAGTGSASNVVSATTSAAGAPGAPTDLTATADGRTAIDLAWTAPADNGGSAISGYRIEVSSDGGSNWTDLVSDTASTATSYEHTNLDPGTERHYRVSAINTAGTGSASNVAHATTEAEPPGAPTGLTATADGKTAIDLAWTVPDDTGGAAVSGYRIEVSSDAGSNWADLVANTGTTATTYAHTGLAAGTERHYRVSAINTAGTGSASNVVSATTSAAGAPGAPTDLTATADGRTAIDLAWTAPGDNGGSAISGYRIEVSSDAGSNWSDLVSDTASTATSYEHTNLDPGTERHYRVSAINTAGTGSASNVANATTEAEPPGAPTGLTATADGKTAIDLAWTTPDDTGGAAVSGYRIEVSSDAGSNWADLVANTGSTATTYAHTGLAAGTERHYRVSAINTAGAGTASNVASATTSAAGAPGAPTGLTATADGKMAIDLAWTAPGTTAAAPSAATASRSPPTAAATGPTWSPTPRARPPPTSTPTWTRGRRGTTGCRRSTRPARAAPPTSPTRRPTRRRRGRPRA